MVRNKRGQGLVQEQLAEMSVTAQRLWYSSTATASKSGIESVDYSYAPQSTVKAGQQGHHHQEI